jgi:hypothetical protein
MTTIVADATDESPDFIRRRTAAVLRFLVAAQRTTRGVTLQALADKHGTQRSNLSAYIRSGGQRRNIAYERLRRVLYELGVHSDFTLRGHFHRWDMGDDGELLDGLKWILAANRRVSTRVMPTAGRHEGFIAFIVVETAGDVVCLIRVRGKLFAAVCSAIGFVKDESVVDEGISDVIQSAWLTKRASASEVKVRRLLATGIAKSQKTVAISGCGISDEKQAAIS